MKQGRLRIAIMEWLFLAYPPPRTFIDKLFLFMV